MCLKKHPGHNRHCLFPLILDGKIGWCDPGFELSKKRIFGLLICVSCRRWLPQIAVASNNALLYEQVQEELAERKKLQVELEEERNLLSHRVKERTADLDRSQ